MTVGASKKEHRECLHSLTKANSGKRNMVPRVPRRCQLLSIDILMKGGALSCTYQRLSGGWLL